MATALQLNAQTEKGKTLLGGETKLEYSTFNAGNDKTHSLEISPQIGRFIVKNFAIGIEIPFNRSKDIDGDSEYITSTAMVMPFARCYFGKSKVKPYIHGAIGPGWGKNKNVISMGPEYETKFNLTGYEAAGGLGVFLNEHVSLDFSLSYGKLATKWTDSSNVDRTDDMKGIDFNIGIVVCL